MKNFLPFIFLAVGTLFAADQIVTIDPSNGRTKASSVYMTNSVIYSTNSIYSFAVQGVTNSAALTTSNNIVKVSTANGKIDVSLIPTISGSKGGLNKMIVLDVTGTWTNANSVTNIYAQAWGGGGGGSGSGTGGGGGGGSGGYVGGFLVCGSTNLGFTIGAGGAGGTAGNPGVDAGNTIFLTFTANGGTGGNNTAASGQGSAGGGFSGGTEKITGGAGMSGGPTVGGCGGTGGGAPKGGGGGRGGLPGAAGSAGTEAGAGGGGAGGNNAGTGGAGAAGRVIIYWNDGNGL